MTDRPTTKLDYALARGMITPNEQHPSTCMHQLSLRIVPFAIPAGSEYPSWYDGSPLHLDSRALAIAERVGRAYVLAGDRTALRSSSAYLVAYGRMSAFPHDSDHDIAESVRMTLASLRDVADLEDLHSQGCSPGPYAFPNLACDARVTD